MSCNTGVAHGSLGLRDHINDIIATSMQLIEILLFAIIEGF